MVDLHYALCQKVRSGAWACAGAPRWLARSAGVCLGMAGEIPHGFSVLETQSPFIRNVGPLYVRFGDERADIGLLIEEVHCNSRGRLHGAMVCAVADIALGQNVARAFAELGAFEREDGEPIPGVGMATVSMSTDFSGTARVGDWIEVHVDVSRAGKRTAFANAYLVHKDERIARVSGVYQVISK